MIPRHVLLLFLTGLTALSCMEASFQMKSSSQKAIDEQESKPTVEGETVYASEHLIVNKLSEQIYQHISFLHTDNFGKVACNGMIVVYESESIVFDTTTDDQSSLELIQFINQELKANIAAVIPTHFHEDCVGGMKAFASRNIPIYASKRTEELLKENNYPIATPLLTFERSLALPLGNTAVYAEYIGEGHTTDNVIGYVPDSGAIFGGCLVKAWGASKGYLGDANTEKWSETVQIIKENYPQVAIVIPGHGKPGGTELFDYTIRLFSSN